MYEVGAQLDAQGGGQMYNLIYQYSFFNNGKVNFGLDGGLSTFILDTKLTRHVSVGEGGTGGLPRPSCTRRSSRCRSSAPTST